MNESIWYKLMLSLFLMCFAFLLVTGAERLIASEEMIVLLPDDVPAAVMICSAASGEGVRGADAVRESGAPQRMMRTCMQDVRISLPDTVLCRDSNGNILSCGSYLRAVYQAFALGDGFV